MPVDGAITERGVGLLLLILVILVIAGAI